MFNNIKGIGPKKEEALNRLGIYNEKELLFLLPRSYEDKRKVYKLSESNIGREVVLKLKITGKDKTFYNKGRSISRLYGVDGDKCQIVFFNDTYSPNKLEISKEYYFFAKVKKDKNTYYIANPQIIGSNPDDLRLQAIYPLTRGLYQKELRKFISQALDKFILADPLDKTILNNRDINKTLIKIHRPDSFKEINEGFSDIIYRKVLYNILSLNYINNKNTKTKSFQINYPILKSFIQGLDFDLTKDQLLAIEDIINDLESDKKNMNRLVQGDVGSGKTIVAIIAALVVGTNHQVAFLAPTEILARQHYENYKDRLAKYNISSEILTGSTSKSEKDRTKGDLSSGSIDLIFATHAILEDDVVFKDLSLVITDEQHKFGVKQRNNIVKKSSHPNLILLSATPIPRTLAIAKHGNLDISNIKSKPKNRKKINTYAVNMKYESRVFDFIESEINKGNKAYIVCPSIDDDSDSDLESVESVYNRLIKYKPQIKTAYMHGKLSNEEKNKIMVDFSKSDLDLIISTTVIEVGIDVKEATIMVVYNAERFGLSQLHQLRGRVGRGSEESFCILICSSNSKNARKRMEIMTNIGDGFQIAEKDLEMRGPGDLLGEKQHGLYDSLLGSANEDIIEKAYFDSKQIIDQDPLLKSQRNKELLIYIKEDIEISSGYLLN